MDDFQVANETNFEVQNNTGCFWYDNCTSPIWRRRLLTAYKVELISILVIIMVSMGCTITVSTLKEHLKRPIGVAIGIAGQFVLLPLMAVGLAHALLLPPDAAIGTLIVSTCPGGAVSNIMTFWNNGDVALSVTMTTISTVMSFGLMPLNLWLYCRLWTTDGANVPYVNIMVTLLGILVPVALGMLIRHKCERAAKIVTKIGSVCSIVIMLAAFVMQSILFPGMFVAPWQISLACSVLPLCGFVVAYLLTALCRRTHEMCRTVAIETAFQNVAMAISIIVMSFPAGDVARYSLPAMIYGVAMTGEGFLLTAAYHVTLKVMDKSPKTGALPEDHLVETFQTCDGHKHQAAL